MANEITKSENGNGFDAKVKEKLLAAIPRHIDQDRFFAIAMGIARGPDLKDCEPQSILGCIYTAAKLGLIPDPILGLSYIIPRTLNKGKSNEVKVATFMCGYKGYIDLARRSGRIGAIITGIAYEGEDFEQWVDERGVHLRHIPSLEDGFDPLTAKPRAIYCIADIIGSWPQVVIMRPSEIRQIATGTNVWEKYPDEMAKKTVVRRAAKLWTLSPELGKAVALDTQIEMGQRQSLDDLSPSAPQLPDSPRQIESLDDEPQDDQNEGTE